MAAGAREITLLGQNVNAYHGATQDGGTAGLGALIRALDDIAGLERIRYTTSHPRDMDEDLIAAHGEVPALMPYIHLPVQSGSDGILEAMKPRGIGPRSISRSSTGCARRGPISQSRRISSSASPARASAISRRRWRWFARPRYAQAYSFKFSARPGTPAATLENQLPESEKAARLEILQDLLGQQQAAFNADTIGRTLPVLFERAGKHPGQIVGRSPYMQAVHVDGGDAIMGSVAEVTITKALPNSLAGRLVNDRTPTGQRAAQAGEGGVRLSSAPRPKPVRPIHLQFDDNRLLPLLFGEHDRNLARIEQELDVGLSSRGNKLTITATDAWAAAAARAAIGALYERLKQGLEVRDGGCRRRDPSRRRRRARRQ